MPTWARVLVFVGSPGLKAGGNPRHGAGSQYANTPGRLSITRCIRYHAPLQRSLFPSVSLCFLHSSVLVLVVPPAHSRAACPHAPPLLPARHVSLRLHHFATLLASRRLLIHCLRQVCDRDAMVS